MSLITVAFVNGIVAAAAVAALAYVCRILYRLDRVARPKQLPIGSDAPQQAEPAFDRYAA